MNVCFKQVEIPPTNNNAPVTETIVSGGVLLAVMEVVIVMAITIADLLSSVQEAGFVSRANLKWLDYLKLRAALAALFTLLKVYSSNRS